MSRKDRELSLHSFAATDDQESLLGHGESYQGTNQNKWRPILFVGMQISFVHAVTLSLSDGSDSGCFLHRTRSTHPCGSNPCARYWITSTRGPFLSGLCDEGVQRTIYTQVQDIRCPPRSSVLSYGKSFDPLPCRCYSRIYA